VLLCLLIQPSDCNITINDDDDDQVLINLELYFHSHYLFGSYEDIVCHIFCELSLALFAIALCCLCSLGIINHCTLSVNPVCGSRSDTV